VESLLRTRIMENHHTASNRPSTVDTLIEIANTVSKRSTCSRRHNGAVIANSNGVVLSTGYNGSLSGMDHCDHECDCGADLTGGAHDDNCLAHPHMGCIIAVHAEANAIYFAARNGVSTKDAIIYCTTEPCVKCAEAIVQSGISFCVYDQAYRIHDGIELLEKAGVVVNRYER
jgi:dCMP deaminase